MTKKEKIQFTLKMEAKYRPNEEAQEAVWMHGCASENAAKIIESLAANENPGEVCCTRPEDPRTYKPYGLFVMGDVRAMFNTDVYSGYDSETKIRFTDEEYWEECVADYSDLEDDGYYTESWVRVKEVAGVWIKHWIYSSTSTIEQAVVEEFKKLGLPITIV